MRQARDIWQRCAVRTLIQGNVFGDGAFGVAIEDSDERGYVPVENDQTRILGNSFQNQSEAGVLVDYGPSGEGQGTVLQGNAGGTLRLGHVGLISSARGQFRRIDTTRISGGVWVPADDALFDLPAIGAINLLGAPGFDARSPGGAWCLNDPDHLGATVSPDGPYPGDLAQYFGTRWGIAARTATDGGSKVAWLSQHARVEPAKAYTLAVWSRSAMQTRALGIEVVADDGTSLARSRLHRNVPGERYLAHTYFNSGSHRAIDIRLSFNQPAPMCWTGALLAPGFFQPGEIGFARSPGH